MKRILNVLVKPIVGRLILTAALLIVVWRNTHWSVALLLTLLSISSELHVIAHSQIRASIDSKTNK